MPVKQQTKRPYHKGKHSERHGKSFLRVYAPYLPLLLIVGFGLFLSTSSSFKRLHSGGVLAYATNTTDSGLLDSTNKERIKNGLEPLKYNVTLDSAAQSKADDMKARNYWSHNTPEGKEPWVFFDQAGYKYYKAAENLAYGFDSSDATVVGWMNSPSHRANLLDPDLREVGFGIVNVENYQNKGPETIVVAEYGLPSGTSNIATTTPEIKISNSDPKSVVASSSTISLPAKKITYAQMLTGGKTPWIGFATGLLIGLIAMYLVLKHTRNFIRTIRSGERFILHHPLFDITIVALLALATIVAQTAGVIH